MKFKILLPSLLLFSLSLSAQKASKTYAITGDGNNDYLWMNIRQVDLNTGTVQKTIFEKNKTVYSITDVNSRQSVTQSAITDANIYTTRNYPTATFVAAAAFDKRTDKLFFIPMRLNELRWIDVSNQSNDARFYSVTSPLLPVSTGTDESNHITRLVIAADGNGYGISNDGNRLIRFSTGKKPVITDMGGLIDAESNQGISIHNKCTSWGGDMVADAYGKLWIISASHHVFEVDMNSRIATHKGAISGLPLNYTTNGAAVNDNGDIVVVSANVFAGYYKINFKDLSAQLIQGSDIKYNASDLANGNLLFQKEADAARKFAIFETTDLPVSGTKVVPNPVTGNSFKVLFDGSAAGVYQIAITDIAGRNIQTSRAALAKGQQSTTVNLLNKPANGTYFVKVLDENGKVLMTEKIVIQ
ncbi:MAG: T9SS type A sorting domain-containing protein [Niastella sp.]|nr:T9SS type A sorting domain-containing protein [Niastella sp.]